jgi:hypothetical protein
LRSEDAPEMQTAVLMVELGSRSGDYVFNDKKWIPFSKGVKFTYAYHLLFLVMK